MVFNGQSCTLRVSKTPFRPFLGVRPKLPQNFEEAKHPETPTLILDPHFLQDIDPEGCLKIPRVSERLNVVP